MIKDITIPGFLLIACLVSGQDLTIDTTLRLLEFEVASTRLKNQKAGRKIRHFDSTTLELSKTLDLGSLLLKKTPIAIQTYNYNGLSTVSVRGNSSRHTGIYWNGILLNPASVGLLDLSLIPSGFFSDIRVSYGGESSIYGSGTVGGSIHLENEPVFDTLAKGSATLKMGSYSDYSGLGHLIFSNKKWYSKTIVLSRRAKNDFYYRDLLNEKTRVSNAALQNFGIMQDVYRKAGSNTVLGGSVWIMDNHKEVPATITSRPSDAYQDDRSLRVVASLKHIFNEGGFSLKGAFFNDLLHYKDPDPISDLAIDSEIETFRYHLVGDVRKYVAKTLMIGSGIEISTVEGKSLNYSDHSKQNQAGLFVMLTKEIPSIQWKYNLNLRQDYIENYKVPFTPSLGAEGRLVKNVIIKGNISRNFRVPTFNDLYWQPGGNPGLKPESSWSNELGLAYKNKGSRREVVEIEITGFSSMVNDWILWLPQGSYWTPQNVQKVRARGFESEMMFSTGFYLSELRFSGGYTFTRSTNEMSSATGIYSFKKQLIYVPLHRFYLDVLLHRKGFYINPGFSYTGQRYTSADNNHQLPGYGIMDIMISRDLTVSNYRFNLRFDLLNLFNTEYQAVQYYPMPGRNYAVTIKLSIN
jgi:vitamin B12 transporter